MLFFLNDNLLNSNNAIDDPDDRQNLREENLK